MTHELSADVVVIGSGICGCLAAERLARTGRSVLILEAGPRVTREQLVLNYRTRPARATGWRRICRRSGRLPRPIIRTRAPSRTRTPATARDRHPTRRATATSFRPGPILIPPNTFAPW